MKRTFLLTLIALLTIPAVAQPPARQREAARKAATQSSAKTATVSERAQLEFPSAMDMPEDVSWRRDIYRVLDLTKDRNAVLYYPEEPQGDRMNLFTYLFKLMMRRQITVYNYTIDGNEDFRASNQVQRKDFLDRNHIRYQEKNGSYRIEDSDIPSNEVTLYYIKESTYFDQHTATFHTQPVALCPVRRVVDEFEVNPVSTPLFWVKYSDVAPYLAKLSLNGSNYNNAATISADDYFTTNQYEGKIYKTNNLQGKVLANYCKTDSDMVKEQKRIEKELTTFQDHVWGTDSTTMKRLAAQQAAQDSLLAAKDKGSKTVSAKRSKSKREDESNSSRSQLKRQKSSGASSSRPTYSVRRQRH